jgi:hypothetical protein
MILKWNKEIAHASPWLSFSQWVEQPTVQLLIRLIVWRFLPIVKLFIALQRFCVQHALSTPPSPQSLCTSATHPLMPIYFCHGLESLLPERVVIPRLGWMILPILH